VKCSWNDYEDKQQGAYDDKRWSPSELLFSLNFRRRHSLRSNRIRLCGRWLDIHFVILISSSCRRH
jgi:hypothetical protein